MTLKEGRNETIRYDGIIPKLTM